MKRRPFLKEFLKFPWILALPILAVTNLFGVPQKFTEATGQYIVVLQEGARPADVANTHALNPHRVYAHALNGFASAIPQGRLHALQNDPRVSIVEPDLQVSALGQTVPYGVQRIGARLSPAAKIDGLDERVNVDIAIIDTGIDLTHPDLNVYRAVSFSINNTTGNDGHGHGTHVAGIAAALDNSIGVVGVAPGARLWAVKVLDDSGSGSVSTIISGIDYVTQHSDEIEVANMSLGGLGTADSMRVAIQNSIAKGVAYVVAAGNSSSDIYGDDKAFATWDDFFPGSYPEVMTVSAIADTDGKPGGTGPSSSYGPDDTIASFSNFSLAVVPNNPVTSPGLAVDVAAPGVNIYSTYKGGTYATMSGTSMASPHVAGAVALYISQNGRANDAAGVARIRQALIDSAESQTLWGPANTNPGRELFDFYPEGLVDVANIGSTPPLNNPPAVAISSPGTSSDFPYGGTITFSGTASDSQDGNLTSNLNWISSLDGQIGSGGSFGRSLSSGTHIISASATDSAGSTTTASVTVTVNAPVNNPPTVLIGSPGTGSSFRYGTPISFSGSASDVQDGSLTSSLTWTSSIDGQIGTGSSFSRILSSGTHTITASATDSAGLAGTATITVVVVPPPKPNLSSTVSTDKASYANRGLASIRVTVTDGTSVVSGGTVYLIVTTSNGKRMTMSGVTGSTGTVNFLYSINTNSGGSGTYSVNATASKSGFNSASCSTLFTATR